MTEVSKAEILSFFEDTPKQFENTTLGRISVLANQVIDLEKEVAEQEAALKRLKEKKRQLAEDLIPAVMTEHGISEITLENGGKVSVKKFYSCTIPKDSTVLAFAWLRDQGHDSLIKRRLTVDFPRDHDTQAHQLKEDLENKGLHPGDNEWVEPSTLRGFAREQVEAGKELPDHLFNLFIGERATIK